MVSSKIFIEAQFRTCNGSLLHGAKKEKQKKAKQTKLQNVIILLNFQEWGAEGYHLWMVNNKRLTSSTEDNSNPHKTELLQMHFVKSALATNPCTVRNTKYPTACSINNKLLFFPKDKYIIGQVHMQG